MYAIVREGSGKFYTSMVFGFYQSEAEDDYKNNFWIVLNKDKMALVRQFAYQQDTKYIIPMILIVDADETGWRKKSASAEGVDFLPLAELPALIDEEAVPETLLQRCLSMDCAYHYQPVREIRTQNDIRDLDWASGGFHDAHIAQLRSEGDALYVLFEGAWGCSIEVWFEGNVAYDVSSRDPDKFDPWWFGSTVVMEKGYIYLIDDDNMTPDKICEGHCWFKARKMKYHIIPD